MSEVLSWVFAILFVLVVIAWYLSYTAARLDRLHVRLSGTLAALDARLVRRAEAVSSLRSTELGEDVLARLASACMRVQLARRFHNDAVTDVRRVRRKWTIRMFHLAGHTPMPHTIEFNDESPEHLAAV